jgi:REP element-mobilizing transposase RayT
MTRPRTELIALEATPWYHVVSRCVRRAFLCGQDHASGQNYEHRRGWIEARLRQLAGVFAIDIAAYAVMSNHYHIVLKVDQPRAVDWSDDEVLERWTRLFSGPLLVQRYLNADTRAQMGEAELDAVARWAETYRQRLADLSWFMRVLNEAIARQANAEDGVTGRFWEGRFKSQALLDEQALLAAMAYVDLNPIRADMAETPEASDYTSIQARLDPDRVAVRMAEAVATEETPSADPEPSPEPEPSLQPEASLSPLPPAPLLPFDATARLTWAIPFAWEDYLELVETLGRCVHPRKRGYMPEHTPALIERLGMDRDSFIDSANTLLKQFGSAVGKPESLLAHAAQRQARFLHGMRLAKTLQRRQAA